MYPPPQGEPAVRVEMPICPSTNNLFINARTGRTRGSQYKRWAQDAGWAVKLQHPVPVHGLVAVLIEAPLNRRRDVDNALKPTLDLLVSLGIIEDDNRIDDLRIVRTPAGAGDGMMVVSIWPI